MISDGLIKSFLGSLFGIGGLGITTPMTYAATTKTSYKTLWRKTIDNGPVIFCSNDDGDKYEVRLVLSGKEDINLGLWKWNEKDKIWWDEGKTYVKWGIKRSSKEGVTFWWDEGDAGFRYDFDAIGGRCGEKENQKIELLETRSGGEIESSNIKFNENDDCIELFFSKTCKIAISSRESGLSWNNKYVPTITYWAL